MPRRRLFSYFGNPGVFLKAKKPANIGHFGEERRG